MATGPMKIQSTTITGVGAVVVEIVIADSADIDQATEYLRMRAIPDKAEARWLLPSIKRAALKRMQDVLAEQILACERELDAR